MPARLSLAELTQGVRGGDRRVLAQAITLVESQLPADQQLAARLLQELLPATGGALRLGVSGAPGVGKSTLLECLGLRLVARHKLAVLAIDPSSPVSGGSILGDKTRMEQLARAPQAFVRPSPGGTALGGVAAHTREAILLCEAAGHDVVIVETVGVGQSETEVANMTDFFLLLVLPGSGDELQGIKRGIMELADAVAITKADGDNLGRARTAHGEFAAAMQVLGHHDTAVLTCSGLTGDGVDALWEHVCARVAAWRRSGALAERRRQQAGRWFDAVLRERAWAEFVRRPEVAQRIEQARADVLAGRIAPTSAAGGV